MAERSPMTPNQTLPVSGRTAEEFAYDCMFGAHPHELAEVDWPKFVAYVRAKAGWEMPEETIREALRETVNPDDQEVQ